ncbi:major facilitator superfamily domain-containing protein [Melampsora americana]|nr:major facilitator superfamily domain-containing protein [Melampsora americana]
MPSSTEVSQDFNKTLEDVSSSKIEKLSQAYIDDKEDEDLPAVDGGYHAWRFLFIAFMIEGAAFETINISFHFIIGHAFHLIIVLCNTNQTGSLCSGILYCSGAIFIPLMEDQRWITKWGPTAGTIACAASCLGSGFCDKASHLIFLQGILYGVGGGDYPSLAFLGEWWVDRRGFAGSVMFTGSSVFGLVYPPLLEWSLKKYGSRVTYQAFAIFWMVIMLPMMPFFGGRLPNTRRQDPRGLCLSRYLRKPIFWAFVAVTLVQSLAYFVPSLYMPSYAMSIGLPGGFTLALYSGASIIGQLLIGTASDHFDSSWLIGTTSLCSGMSIFVLWGYCNGLAMLASFAIIYGLSAGGFSCLWQRFAMLVAPSEPKSGNLIAFFTTSRGIANILTGPIAGAILEISSSEVQGYRMLVYYSGSLMLISSLGVGIRLLYTPNKTI